MIGREYKEGFWGRTGNVLLLAIWGDCMYAHVVTNHRVTYFRVFVLFCTCVISYNKNVYTLHFGCRVTNGLKGTKSPGRASTLLTADIPASGEGAGTVVVSMEWVWDVLWR